MSPLDKRADSIPEQAAVRPVHGDVAQEILASVREVRDAQKTTEIKVDALTTALGTQRQSLEVFGGQLLDFGQRLSRVEGTAAEANTKASKAETVATDAQRRLSTTQNELSATLAAVSASTNKIALTTNDVAKQNEDQTAALSTIASLAVDTSAETVKQTSMLGTIDAKAAEAAAAAKDAADKADEARRKSPRITAVTSAVVFVVYEIARQLLASHGIHL